MRIKNIISQHRRDFHAIMICESCNEEEEIGGYDDRNYHENVIPNMKCSSCGETAKSNFKPLTTKYPDGMQV